MRHTSRQKNPVTSFHFASHFSNAAEQTHLGPTVLAMNYWRATDYVPQCDKTKQADSHSIGPALQKRKF